MNPYVPLPLVSKVLMLGSTALVIIAAWLSWRKDYADIFGRRHGR